LTFPANVFSNAQNRYFLFEGTGVGSGELVLTVSKGTNIIAETGVWLDLRDVKNMYERAYATNVANGLPPSDRISSFKNQPTLPANPNEAK
jgi:hypothetical protein